jgi:CheY-like chemotaxis protein
MSRILVVDDHAVTREPLARLLRYEGYETVAAANGAEALLAMYEAPADLVLLDLMMPRMDGVDFLTALRGEPRFQKTPVMLMTAVPQSARLEQARALSGIEVIQKARFELPELLSRIRGALVNAQAPELAHN